MSLTILAIDDSSTMRRLVQSTLVQSGYAVEVAEDGIDGLEKLDQVKPDLVITDINMPRMKQRARKAGASGWIVKPFDKDKLLMAIKRVCGV